VVQFNLVKPSYLPFHMIVWGQHFVRNHNCHQFIKPNVTSTSSSGDSSGTAGTTTSTSTTTTGAGSGRRDLRGGKRRANVFAGLQDEQQLALDSIQTSTLPKDEVFEICWPNSIRPSWGGPYNISYMKKSEKNHYANTHASQGLYFSYSSSNSDSNSDGNSNSNSNSNGNGNGNSNSDSNSNTNGKGTRNGQSKDRTVPPIRYVYYTEMDQVVRFDEEETLKALSLASNSTTFFSGRRKEKSRDSDPSAYMGGLDNWRNCGAPGYILKYPPVDNKNFHVLVES
jgi:hypothetical protein